MTFNFRQNSLDVAQWSLLDDYALSDFEKWPRLQQEVRFHNGLKRSYFALVDRFRHAAYPEVRGFSSRDRDPRRGAQSLNPGAAAGPHAGVPSEEIANRDSYRKSQ